MKIGKVGTQETPTLVLPSSATVPVSSLDDCTGLLYGLEKIGKTSFLSNFPDALFLMFEPGGKGLSLYKMDVMNWKHYLQILDLLYKDKRYRTVIVDTADIAAKMCEDFKLRQLAIQHASDEDWGKGWAMIRDEFTKGISALLKTGKGIWFTSHATTREIKSRNGLKYDRTLPTMTKFAREIIEPMVDIWAYMEYDDKGQRRIQLAGSTELAAGHRLEGRFVGVDSVPMGNTSKEAYQNFVAAFEGRAAQSAPARPAMTFKARR